MKRRSVTLVAMMFAYLYVLVLHTTTVFSTIYVLGVDKGDWALYNIHTSWASTIPGETVPQYAKDMNNSQWKLNVEKVFSPQKVRLSITKDFRNGTKRVEVCEGDVKTGFGNLSSWVISKGLELGDYVYEGKELNISYMESQEFAEATRQIVYARFKQVEPDDSIGEYHMFWDRETGILCGMSVARLLIVEDESSLTYIGMELVETSLWEPSVNSDTDDLWHIGFGIAILLIFVVMGASVLIQRRRK